MDAKDFIIKTLEIIKGTLIGKVILALIAGGLTLLGASPFFDKYISALLEQYFSIKASDPSLVIGICLVLLGVGLAIWERKNQLSIETQKIKLDTIRTQETIDKAKYHSEKFDEIYFIYESVKEFLKHVYLNKKTTTEIMSRYQKSIEKSRFLMDSEIYKQLFEFYKRADQLNELQDWIDSEPVGEQWETAIKAKTNHKQFIYKSIDEIDVLFDPFLKDVTI